MSQSISPAAEQIPPDHVVVGVDGSPGSIDALGWAVRQAETTGSGVEAVICWHYPPSNGMEISSLDGDWEADAGATLISAIGEVSPGAGVHILPTVAYGRATDVLVDRSADAQLLVVGSRGHGSLTGVLLGSVSQRVITHAHCPVVVVKPGLTDRQARDSLPRSSVASTAT